MTPNELQIIVDGECSHADRARMLKSIGENSKEWRTLALALLEEQQWSRQIAQSDQGMLDSVLVNSCSSPIATAAMVQPMIHPFVSEGRSKLGTGYRSFLAALAASVLLGVGYYGGLQGDIWFAKPPAPGQRIMDSASLATSKSDAQFASSPGHQNDKMKIVLTGPNSETAEIPVYDIKDFDPSTMWASEDFEFKRANEQLRRRGFELDVRPEFYTGTLNDGRQLVVPVKQVGLRPYGQ